jgi:ubiquitin carboxyl-terminal hydrolase 10
MSNRHLPAGHNLQAGVGSPHGVDMGGPGAGGGGGGGGLRRRAPPPQYMPQYHHPMGSPMYAYSPYANQQFYPMAPQYQAASMPSPTYNPYQNYSRSPPSMPQYVPMVGVSVPPSYPRQAQQSPALATPYQPPPAPVVPQTPSSSHSSQMPPQHTPPTPQSYEPVVAPAPAPAPAPASAAAAPAVPAAPATPAVAEPAPVTSITPFRPPLPWLSRPELDFPRRIPKSRRRKKALDSEATAVSLPTEQSGAPEGQNDAAAVAESTKQAAEETAESHSPPADLSAPVSKLAQASARGSGPVVPALPKPSAKPAKIDAIEEVSLEATEESKTAAQATESEPSSAQPAPARAPPARWANLFTSSQAAGHGASGNAGGSTTGEAAVNGGSTNAVNGAHLPGSAASKANALAEVIRSFRVSNDKISFLEPRGLINTGNMCYLNSVLQILTFCAPFYDFMDQVSKRAAHSFKSDTPLIDAM